MTNDRKALVVGMSDYPGVNALPCCANDATVMKELLEKHGDGSDNFDVKDIVGTCSKADLWDAIQRTFEGDSNIAVALFYFSGHGSIDENGRGAIRTTDGGAIEMNEVARIANASKCRNRVIILDCCYAGAAGNKALPGITVSELGDGVTIIAASECDQTAMGGANSNELSTLTSLLRQGLNGLAATGDGGVTAVGLYAFVDTRLGPWDQRPVFKTNVSQIIALRTVVARKVQKPVSDMVRRLSVKFSRHMSFTHSVLGWSPVFATLSVEVTNTGDEDLFLKDVEINFCGKLVKMLGVDADGVSSVDATGRIKFPYKLVRGDVFKDTTPTMSIVDAVKEGLDPSDNLKFVVRDTLGNKFYSQEFTYGDLLQDCKNADECNKQHGKS